MTLEQEILKLQNHKIALICLGLIGVLLFATPTLVLLVKPPVGEAFSELYILGPNHTLSGIPFNVRANVTYSVYFGVGNHMGSSSYYTGYVKLRNETDPLPNLSLGTPSSLPLLYEYDMFVENGATWESRLALTINNVTFFDNSCLLQSINLNGLDFNVAKTAVWNSQKLGYYYDLVFELWIYNVSSASFQFHDRFVHFNLNVTQS